MFRNTIGLTALVMVGLLLPGVARAGDSSLVGWWKLDDGSGTIAKDSSGNGSDGTLNGGAVWVEGVLDGALEIDGSTGNVEIPANINQAIINKGDFSMMAWIKTTDIAGTNYAFQQGDGNGNGRSWLFTANSGEITTYVGVGNFGSGVIMELDEWYHAGFTVIEGGDSDTLQMYVNGVAEGAQGTRAMETCEGGYLIGSHKGLAAGSRWPGAIDDIRLYNRALGAADIQEVMLGQPELAYGPVPEDKATGVLRDATLTWTPGEFANTHDVYFGTVFEDVNSASVPTSAGLDVNAFDPGPLAFGQTYFWRVDEVNAAPDNTVFKGNVWSFTTEPYSVKLAAEVIVASASSVNNETTDPNRTIDGSGLDNPNNMNALHSTEVENVMWMSASGDLSPWLMYEFDTVQKLDKLLIWNSNHSSETVIGWGAKDVDIQISEDGTNWSSLPDVGPIAQASGFAPSEAQAIDMGLALAKYVKLNILSNWGGLLPQYGLAEVQFYALPVYAHTPDPASGSVDVLPSTTVSWQAGREADTHVINVGVDPNALADGSAASVSSTQNSADLISLDLQLDQLYYWQVDEVNEAETPSVWAGPVWNLTTVPYLTVDDFDSYSNISPDRPFQTWLDGFGYSADEFFPTDYAGNGTGSGVGHDIWSVSSPHFDGQIMEGTNAKNGQSLPLYFNNTNGLSVSETQRTLDPAQDWTAHGIQSLSLNIHGDMDNSGQLYLKINDTRIDYAVLSDGLQREQWTPWIIDLSTVNTNLQNVTSLAIGVEGAGATGLVYIDEIRLYASQIELTTPVIPSDDGLVGAWNFNEGSGAAVADSSGNGLTGTIVDATWDTGIEGSALLFGETAYVETGHAGVTGTGSRTYAAWIKTLEANRVFLSNGLNTAGRKWRMRLDVTGGLRMEVNGGYHYGQAFLADDEWHHTALVLEDDGTPDVAETLLYVDGLPETTRAVLGEPIDTDPTGELRIGKSTYDGVGFIGLIDDARVYDRALSAAEIMGLAGMTESVPKPF